ncbi:hypothetical protein [Arundinibacter roseus]|uniref:Uncharacterized protein n=1 Tax=Arundinibacter roseus TaxID=2070510 RepID=A0A4R4KC52_9BACT|nr:hypothetical protein [Arundinibacter roseus]TDB64031.1 hypothetical protein EZE20_13885 [Arundinibacter roseus]
MESLQLLLVSIREEWQNCLIQTLQSSGYEVKIKVVSSKKQALLACYQSKFELLVTNESLADGACGDLVHVLGYSMPCLIVQEEGTVAGHITEHSCSHALSLPAQQPDLWEGILKEVIRGWENRVATKIAQGEQNQRSLYHKVAARCASELYHSTENRIENALKVLLDIMELSRVYIREAASSTQASAAILHEIVAPGQKNLNTPFGSTYEVLIPRPNGERTYLGVEDSIKERNWQNAEIDLLKAVASLLKETRGGIRRKINMYSELSMSA